jgi:hypothetical protein
MTLSPAALLAGVEDHHRRLQAAPVFEHAEAIGDGINVAHVSPLLDSPLPDLGKIARSAYKGGSGHMIMSTGSGG